MFKNKGHIVLSLTAKHVTENHAFKCSCFLSLTNVFFSFWVYIKFFFAQIFHTKLFFKFEKQMKKLSKRLTFCWISIIIVNFADLQNEKQSRWFIFCFFVIILCKNDFFQILDCVWASWEQRGLWTCHKRAKCGLGLE